MASPSAGAPARGAATRRRAHVELRFCDDLGDDGFGWIVEEPMTRTSHALAADGKVWLVDALDWPDAIERALGLGEPAGVIQLLDRHDRDCAALATRLAVPHLVAPDEIPGSPFDIRRRRAAQALARVGALVAADADARHGGRTRDRTPSSPAARRRSACTSLLRLTPRACSATSSRARPRRARRRAARAWNRRRAA